MKKELASKKIDALATDSYINIENLKSLDLCGSEAFDFVCLPIKTENSDGAPCRAIAKIGEDK